MILIGMIRYEILMMSMICTTTFLVIAKDCLPTKEIIVRENDNPWFNNTLRQEIRIRDRIRKKFFFIF